MMLDNGRLNVLRKAMFGAIILVALMTSASFGHEMSLTNVIGMQVENNGCIVLAETYSTETAGLPYDVYVSGDYAYIADGGSGLAVIDVSDPTSPTVVGTRDIDGSARGIFVRGNYAYVATYYNGLAVIDISDPTDPDSPFYEDISGYGCDVFVSGNYAYLAASYAGLAVIDISSPTNPGTPVYENTDSYAYGVYVSGDYAYLAGSTDIAIIDISNSSDPGTPVYVDEMGGASNIIVNGNYAYAAAGSAGLAVIDVSDPTNPSTPVFEDTTGGAVDIAISGNYAYVADSSSGLAVMDISTNPMNPGTAVYEEFTTGSANDIWVIGDYAYVTYDRSYYGGLAVIETSPIINPVTTSTTSTTTGTSTGDPTTTNAVGIDSSPMIPILATGGGIAIFAIFAVLFIVKTRSPGDVISTLLSFVREEPIMGETTDSPVEEALDDGIIEEPLVIDKIGVRALRGCAVVGGKFDYKVKVINNTDSVITNTTVTILSYPDDCLRLSEGTTKTLKRIGPGEFRSPQFTFIPTKDCVEGRVIATVSYIDHQDTPHTLQVEPYLIRSVCDLLEPLESTMQQFRTIIGDMEQTIEERTLSWNPRVLYSKVLTFLPSRNFHIVDSSEDTIGDVFTGSIRGLAEGKYTHNKVAIRILISGDVDVNESKVVVEGLGEDIAMLPTTLEEIGTGINSWTCMNCGASLEPDEVDRIRTGVPIGCRYCIRTMTIEQYRK